MSRTLIKAGIISIAVFGALTAYAASEADITFPIAELGSCTSKEECKNYCNAPENTQACIAFAEKHNLIPKEQAQQIRKAAVKKGPGGCEGPEACRSYCDDPSHMEECLAFGEENGLMSKEEAARARKLGAKPGPGGCRGRQCQDFCNKPENAEACIEFAEREGLIPKEEVERAKKFMSIASQGGPGGCRGPEECRAFCENPSNHDACFKFAKEQGLIRPEEQAKFEAGQKIQEKLQTSGGPGGCRSEEECRGYCGDPSHVEECVAFAAAHGGVPKEQAERMLKEFTERRFEARGEFRPPEEFKQFEEEAQRRFEEFRALEENFRGENAQFQFGPPPGMEGGPFPSGGPNQGGPGGPGGFVGPGGCTSPTECIKYCSEHKDECFGGPGGPGGSERGPQENMLPGSEGSFHRPQLRTDLLQQLPAELQGKTPQEIKQAFESGAFRPGNMMPGAPPQVFPGRGGEFPGAPGVFPGGPKDFDPKQFEGKSPEEIQKVMESQIRSGMMPPGDFRQGSELRPEMFQGAPPEAGKTGERTIPQSGQFPGIPPEGFKPGENITRPEGFNPPEGFQPPAGFQPPQNFQGAPPAGDFRPPEGQFQFQQPPTGDFRPPEGTQFQPPPGGEFRPPEGSAPPPGGTFTAPPSGGEGSQPPPPPPPQGRLPQKSLFGLLVSGIKSLFGK